MAFRLPQVQSSEFRTAADAMTQIERFVLRMVQANSTGSIAKDAGLFHPDWLLGRVLPLFDVRVDPKFIRAVELTGVKMPSNNLVDHILSHGNKLPNYSSFSFRDRALLVFGEGFLLAQTKLDDHCKFLTGGPFLNAQPKLFAPPPGGIAPPFRWLDLALSSREPKPMLERVLEAGLLFQVNEGGGEDIATAAEAVRAGHVGAMKRASGETFQEAYRRHVLSDIDQLAALIGGIVHRGGSTTSLWSPVMDEAKRAAAIKLMSSLGIVATEDWQQDLLLVPFEAHRIPSLPKRNSFVWMQAAFDGSPPAGCWPVALSVEALLKPDGGVKADDADRSWADAFKRSHDAFVGAFAAGHLRAVGSRPDGSGEMTVPADFWGREDAALDLVKGDFYVAGNVVCRSIRVQRDVEQTLAPGAGADEAPKPVSRKQGGANVNGSLTTDQSRIIIELLDYGLLKEDFSNIQDIKFEKYSNRVTRAVARSAPGKEISGPASPAAFSRLMSFVKNVGVANVKEQVELFRADGKCLKPRRLRE